MLNFASIEKMKPGYINKAKARGAVRTRKGGVIQKPSIDTRYRFVKALRLGEWVTCQSVILATGLSAGTISRASHYLLSHKVIVKKSTSDGRNKVFHYKLLPVEC